MKIKNLEKLLEYQEIDIQLRRLLDVIEKSDDQKKMEQAKSEFSLAKKIVEESDKSAASLVDFFGNSKKYYDEVEKRIEALEKEPSDEDLQAVLEQLSALRERLNQLDGKITDKKKRSETVMRAYTSANERGRKIRDIHSRAKERQDALLKSKQPQIDELRGKLALLEPTIDAEMMAQYKSITAERKYPAFVEVYIDGKTFSCKGCGIALSQKSSSLLTESGSCICESCRRLIYKK